MRHRKPCRLGVAVTLLSSVLCATSGCSLFDFGRHDSFDEWYSGPEDALDPKSIGWTSLDGEFTGYVVNDMLLRTPAMLVYETTRTALVPFAASCFARRSVFGGGAARGDGVRGADAPGARSAPAPAEASPGERGSAPEESAPEESAPEESAPEESAPEEPA